MQEASEKLSKKSFPKEKYSMISTFYELSKNPKYFERMKSLYYNEVRPLLEDLS